MVVVTNQLSRFELLQALPEAEQALLVSVAVRRSLPGGTLLFRQGDPTPGLHLVEQGAIKIYSLTETGAERIIDLIGRGGCCGEMGIIDRVAASAWGETLGPTELWIIPAAALERLLLAHPAFCLSLCRVVVGRLRQTGQQLEEAIRLGARQRVLRSLLRLLDQHGEAVPGGIRLGVRLTHEELSRLAGTARETVSRALLDLQDRQVIRFVGRQLTVIDPDQLRALAFRTDRNSEVDRPLPTAVR
ncbi:MAG TPA: Crp/Fnr family transcriptional regulator [Symbiobacteriaceae bacterium]|nr:Crp/Fnr family transcriptional regulator [Symbiobacteriaceae bacterium]